MRTDSVTNVSPNDWGTADPRRRTLVKALALAGAPFISTSTTRALAEGGRPRLGFALCGLGQLSTHELAPALQRTAHCRLAGIVTGTPSKATEWKARYAIPARNVYDYASMHRMADNPDIDVVYVVTPNGLHLDHARAAAQAGKHVFCEKPMELSVDRCQQMIDACKAAGRRLAVAYRCRFEPHHLECIRLARQRDFGAVRLIDAHFGFTIGPGVWRLRRAMSGGGPLMDVGIYALQAARYIAGEEPSTVSAIATHGHDTRFTEVEESIAFQAVFPDGAIAHCGTSYNTAGIGYLRVLAERGWFGLDPAFNYDGIRGTRSDGRAIAFGSTDQFAVEMDDFARRIIEGTGSPVPGEEGLRDVRLMMSIYEAAATARAVSVS